MEAKTIQKHKNENDDKQTHTQTNKVTIVMQHMKRIEHILNDKL